MFLKPRRTESGKNTSSSLERTRGSGGCGWCDPCPLLPAHSSIPQLLGKGWGDGGLLTAHTVPFPTELPLADRSHLSRRCRNFLGFPGGKKSACQCRKCKRCRFNPQDGKMPWKRKWQPTPVFLPGKSHGHRSLAGYSPWGRKKSDRTEQLSTPSLTYRCWSLNLSS